MQRNSRRGSDVNKLGDLIKLERLGEGTYGTVFKVHNKKTGELSAMKQIKILGGDADGGVPSSAVREISLLRSLDHPNIIQLKEIIHGILSKPVNYYTAHAFGGSVLVYDFWTSYLIRPPLSKTQAQGPSAAAKKG